MKGKLKQTKGITLIALIITIIVLLILAVVSIRLVINNGILGKAEYATQKYTEEEATEQEKLLKAEYEMAKYEGKATGTYEEYVLDKMYGLKIGDYVNYDPTKDENGNAVAVQSYTSYSTDDASSEKNEGRSSGYSSNQVFNLSSYTGGWRVLGIENGKIQLISEEFIGPDEGGYTNSTYNRTYYYLKGQKGYTDGPGELNAIAGMYGQGKGATGARSVTVEDINKITGYNPKTAQPEKGEFWEYNNKVTYTRGEGTALSSSGTNGKTWSGTQSTFIYYDEETRTFKDLTSGSTDITSTSYYYNPVTLNEKAEKPIKGVNEDGAYNTAYEMLFGKYSVTEANGYSRNFTGTGAPQGYWLASPSVITGGSGANFGLRYVRGGGVGDFSCLFITDGSIKSNALDDELGLRAVVSLKSDIQIEKTETNDGSTLAKACIIK